MEAVSGDVDPHPYSQPCLVLDRSHYFRDHLERFDVSQPGRPASFVALSNGIVQRLRELLPDAAVDFEVELDGLARVARAEWRDEELLEGGREVARVLAP